MKHEIREMMFNTFTQQQEKYIEKLLDNLYAENKIEKMELVFKEVYGVNAGVMKAIHLKQTHSIFSNYTGALISLTLLRRADVCNNYDLFLAKQKVESSKLALYKYIFSD